MWDHSYYFQSLTQTATTQSFLIIRYSEPVSCNKDDNMHSFEECKGFYNLSYNMTVAWKNKKINKGNNTTNVCVWQVIINCIIITVNLCRSSWYPFKLISSFSILVLFHPTIAALYYEYTGQEPTHQEPATTTVTAIEVVMAAVTRLSYRVVFVPHSGLSCCALCTSL